MNTIADSLKQCMTEQDLQNMAAFVDETLTIENIVNDANFTGLEKEREQALEDMKIHYEFYNQTLANIANQMDYHGQPEKWKDSEPIAVMVEVFTGLHKTNWYDLQMSRVMLG